MRIAVIGSRTFADLDQVYKFVSSLPRTVMVISGGARGVDETAERAARERRISRLVYEPKVEENDPRYVSELHARNDRIIAAADKIVAFWDGKSRGTRSVIDKARKLGKDVEVRGPR